MASKLSKAVSKVKSAVKNYASNVKGGAGIVAGAAKTIIKKVGSASQTGNALKATTLPGAGNVFTGNTPQQKAKSAREQAISNGTAANGMSLKPVAKPNGMTLKPGGMTLKPGATQSSVKSSRGSSQTNSLGNQTLYQDLGGINTSSNKTVAPATLGRQLNSTPTTSVVNAQDIASTQRVTFPTAEDTFIPTITPIAPLDQQKLDLQNESQNNFQSYLDSFTPPPSSEAAYNKAQKQAGTLQKQQTVNELTGKLNSIVSQGEANKLSVVGQGRGIPEAILGGQQAQFARETAIQALPVQAQLSAAQGDLEAAEQNLNTLFKIYSDDATNAYNYKKGIKEAIYNFTDKQTQTKLQEIQKKQDREYEQQQADLKTRQSLAIEANKNGASSAVTTAILNAPDMASAIKAMGRWGVNPTEQAIKNLSLKKLQNELSGDTTTSLTQDQKEKIASNPTAKQSVARIGVISAVKDYISKLEQYKGPSNTIDFNRLTTGEEERASDWPTYNRWICY